MQGGSLMVSSATPMDDPDSSESNHDKRHRNPFLAATKPCCFAFGKLATVLTALTAWSMRRSEVGARIPRLGRGLVMGLLLSGPANALAQATAGTFDPPARINNP